MSVRGAFVGAVVLNVLSSVGVSMSNKLALAKAGTELAPALTLLHFLSTALYTGIQVRSSGQEFAWHGKHLGSNSPRMSTMMLKISAVAFLNMCSVVLTITSVGRNTIEFYQLAKLLALPCTVAIEFVFYKSRFGWSELASLLLVVVGVGMATVQHIYANSAGAAVAVAAVVVSSVAQVAYSKMLQQSASSDVGRPESVAQQQQLSSQQITLLIYATSSVMLIIGGLLCAPWDSWPHVLIQRAGWRVPLSCLLAVGINWSTSRVLELSSAVTYLVVGQAKVCLTLAVGWFLFQQTPTVKGICGTVVALGGMFWYSIQKQHKKEQGKNSSPADHVKKDA